MRDEVHQDSVFVKILGGNLCRQHFFYYLLLHLFSPVGSSTPDSDVLSEV